MTETKLYAVLDEKGEAVVGVRAFAGEVPPHKRDILRLREMDDPGEPAMPWFQQIDGHDFQIAADRVTKTYRVVDRPLRQIKNRRQREVDAELLQRAGVARRAEIQIEDIPAMLVRLVDLLVDANAATSVRPLQLAAKQHKQAIEALGDAASVLAYDITTGW